jgi:hypothetical protein
MNGMVEAQALFPTDDGDLVSRISKLLDEILKLPAVRSKGKPRGRRKTFGPNGK